MSEHESGDDVYFGTFIQLCEVGLVRTAKEMIEETWEVLSQFESGDSVALSTAEAEDCVAGLRQALMLMLSDLDGTELKKWRAAYRDDRNDFSQKAEQVVLIWYERLHHKNGEA